MNVELSGFKTDGIRTKEVDVVDAATRVRQCAEAAATAERRYEAARQALIAAEKAAGEAQIHLRTARVALLAAAGDSPREA